MRTYICGREDCPRPGRTYQPSPINTLADEHYCSGTCRTLGSPEWKAELLRREVALEQAREARLDGLRKANAVRRERREAEKALAEGPGGHLSDTDDASDLDFSDHFGQAPHSQATDPECPTFSASEARTSGANGRYSKGRYGGPCRKGLHPNETGDRCKPCKREKDRASMARRRAKAKVG